MNNVKGKIIGNPLVTPMNGYTKKEVNDRINNLNIGGEAVNWSQIQNKPDIYTKAEIDSIVGEFSESLSDSVGQNAYEDLGGVVFKRGEIFNDYENNEARADYSHAEGFKTKAFDMCAHSEGMETEAHGIASHTEGLGTKSSNGAQHVQGRYNEYDDEYKYAHIVGGGESDSDRKNIHTIDWDGNAMFAGDVEVHHNGKAYILGESIQELQEELDSCKDLSIKRIIVKDLPDTGEENAIYFVSVENGTENNLFDEYIFVEEKWEKIGSKSVEIDLTDYVKNTDYGSNNKAGLVRGQTSYGTSVNASNGVISLVNPTKANIDAKVGYIPITPKMLDYAIKVGLTTNTEPLTDEEKIAAQKWLGIIE